MVLMIDTWISSVFWANIAGVANGGFELILKDTARNMSDAFAAPALVSSLDLQGLQWHIDCYKDGSVVIKHIVQRA